MKKSDLVAIVAWSCCTAAAILPFLLIPMEGTAVTDTRLLQTVHHDGHKWVIAWAADGPWNKAMHFAHHPDCPCKKAEAE